MPTRTRAYWTYHRTAARPPWPSSSLPRYNMPRAASMCCEALPRHARLHSVRCILENAEFMISKGISPRWPLNPLNETKPVAVREKPDVDTLLALHLGDHRPVIGVTQRTTSDLSASAQRKLILLKRAALAISTCGTLQDPKPWPKPWPCVLPLVVPWWDLALAQGSTKPWWCLGPRLGGALVTKSLLKNWNLE